MFQGVRRPARSKTYFMESVIAKASSRLLYIQCRSTYAFDMHPVQISTLMPATSGFRHYLQTNGGGLLQLAHKLFLSKFLPNSSHTEDLNAQRYVT